MIPQLPYLDDPVVARRVPGVAARVPIPGGGQEQNDAKMTRIGHDIGLQAPINTLHKTDRGFGAADPMATS